MFEVLLIEVFCGLSTLFFQQKGGTVLSYRWGIWELGNKVDVVEAEVPLVIGDSWCVSDRS